MIIDGGPNGSLLRELSKIMPWYDRSVDVLMVTNPDADHYAGFIDLLKRYQVGEILEPGTISKTETYKIFEKEIKDSRVPDTIARRGMIIDLGGGAYFKVLFPDRDVSKLATNDGSIVGQLVYGSTTIMFTGDAPNATEEYILSLDGVNVKSTILKEGHHGSRTSASEKFISAVAPEYDVISAGLNNRYGHPHKETLDLLEKLHIPTLITYKLGTIIFKSDGKTYSITH
jgi:competence protein ComEC